MAEEDIGATELSPLEKAWVVRIFEIMKDRFKKGGDFMANHREMNRESDSLKTLSVEEVGKIAKKYKPGLERIIFGEDEID